MPLRRKGDKVKQTLVINELLIQAIQNSQSVMIPTGNAELVAGGTRDFPGLR